MAEPSFLGDSTTPRRSDAKWVRWVKILGSYQNAPLAIAANNPRRSDGIRVIKQKVLNAVRGTSYTG